jgi:hypothetical protein
MYGCCGSPEPEKRLPIGEVGAGLDGFDFATPPLISISTMQPFVPVKTILRWSSASEWASGSRLNTQQYGLAVDV